MNVNFPPNHLALLPMDVQVQIFKYLPLTQILPFNQVAKVFQTTVNRMIDEIYRTLTLKDYNFLTIKFTQVCNSSEEIRLSFSQIQKKEKLLRLFFLVVNTQNYDLWDDSFCVHEESENLERFQNFLIAKKKLSGIVIDEDFTFRLEKQCRYWAKAMDFCSWEVIYKAVDCGELLKHAADKGDSTAIFYQSINLLNKFDVSHTDMTSAKELLKRASKLGCAPAQFEYALSLGEQPGLENKSIKWMKLSHALHYAPAQSYLAEAYLLGKYGLEIDKEKALRLHYLAAESGDPVFQWKLGCRLCEIHKFSEALAVFLKAAPYNSNAMYKVGRLLETGQGVMKNIDLAVKWYKKSLNEGVKKTKKRLLYLANEKQSAEAQYVFGSYLANFEPPLFNREESQIYYHKAAKQGHAKAQYYLGKKREEAFETLNPLEKAKRGKNIIKWFHRSALKGYSKAIVRLAQIYDFGQLEINKDPEKAFKWYLKGALLNDADCKNNLGTMYEKGEGREINEIEAFNWYNQAAHDNHPMGLYNLGTLYNRGLGVLQDQKKARILFQKAGDLGVMEAFNALAYMYEKGLGGPQDMPKAQQLYFLSAYVGNSAVGRDNHDRIVNNLYRMVYAPPTKIQRAYKVGQQLLQKGKNQVSRILLPKTPDW